MSSPIHIGNHIEVIGNRLTIAGEDCASIADRFGTPVYVYNIERVIENYKRLRDSLTHYADRDVVVYYAVKANPNPVILESLAHEGAHADVVSPYEAELALRNGYDASKVMFTGTSVTDETMEYLLERNVLINIDSFSQMRRLAKLVPEGLPVSVRWNPGEGAGFNPAVITAGAESHGRPIKFGIEEGKILELCEEALSLGLKPIGLHQHIGSGWTGADVTHFLDTVDATLRVASKMTDMLGYKLDQLDLGGGPGIPYRPGQPDFPVETYGEGIFSRIKDSGLDFERLCVESGRYIVGDAGVLLTQVNTVEKKYGNLIVGVDAGFNTLVRPAFYGSYEDEQFHETYHHMVVAERVEGPRESCTVAGPLCETGDLLAVKRDMTRPEEGETLAILGAGAYGYSMASIYNFQPRPPEVIVPSCKVATRRETLTDLIHLYSDR